MDDKIVNLFETQTESTFDQVSIRIASPKMIREWSHGEVKTPETINYRTFKPEKDGLFCERIFGPTKDWECACGKYKRIKHKGVVCDRCGVEVTLSNVRRERMGSIELAVPVSHIWFLKSPPSRIGNVLGLSTRILESVIYYENYIVIYPGPMNKADLEKYEKNGKKHSSLTGLTDKQLLSEEEYRNYREKFGDKFEAEMGASAIQKLLSFKEIKGWDAPRGEDLEKLAERLVRQLEATGSKQTKKRLAKRLRIVENFRNSETKPEWMILDVIPVIPPDLRPLVPLEGGRFATSDLNDLYRRVINRNNRLKSILRLKTPEVIVRNEKRMLQEAVDALFDNGRQGRAVLGAANRPLKSLSDNLRGKQGRFRQNLLGKRVDYSGRSVIVVGPELKLNQCGLPKTMALELFEPFIIHRLKELGYVHTIRSAKKMIERKQKEVWDVLDEVIKDHPVMLNRAPTLHRLGIQAFDPVLVEGKAIRIHPLVCTAFNADFDGDQMAVHVPLSNEAQEEARTLMYASNNIFSPASGEPISNPTQDIALGCYFLTRAVHDQPKASQPFGDMDEVLLALSQRSIDLHERIKVRGINAELVECGQDGKPLPPSEWRDYTTAGRVIFNQIFPPEIDFINKQVTKNILSEIVSHCYQTVGHEETVKILDSLKDLGFESSTWSGLSLGMQDMVEPADKGQIIQRALKEVATAHRNYDRGSITKRECYNKVVDIWTHASRDLSERVFHGLSVAGEPGLNPLYMMVASGARGSRQQVQQLAGMRGLMAKPSGEIIEYPILANFREGLSVLEYFTSTHGARKGLADTALKTADSGYLTRRLVDVAQDLIITMEDCGTIKGRRVEELLGQDEVIIPIKERVVGRIALENIKSEGRQGKIIVKRGEEITPELAEEIEKHGINSVRIRSVLSCEAPGGICSQCYGRSLHTHRMAKLGEAVGIIAAQSIGEPGTQLTMRTFHIGGTASLFARQPEYRAKAAGIVKYERLETVPGPEKGTFVVLKSGGTLTIYDEEAFKKGQEVELERFKIEVGSELYVADESKVEKRQLLVSWDPHSTPILSENDGVVEYIDIIEGETMEVQRTKNRMERLIKPVTGRKYHPQINIREKKTKKKLEIDLIPSGAIVEVEDGAEVKAGDRLARTPRKITKTKDITGGLPRVAELFEARRPKDAATIAQISGKVEFGERKRGKIVLYVKDPDLADGKPEEHLIPLGTHIIVHNGEWVKKGQSLTEGPIVLQEMLDVSGMEELQEYLINQVQEVYRLQGVKINDKHIEMIVRQMVSKVKVTDPGATDFLFDEQVDRFTFLKENERIKPDRPAKSKNLLLGITKASLATESFISAASFQETTRVLTDAAASVKIDYLKGFKENVIMGHLIPAGTGFPAFTKRMEDLAVEGEKESKLKS